MIINFTNPVTYSKVLYKIATMKTLELSHPVVSPENLYNDPFYCVYSFAPMYFYKFRFFIVKHIEGGMHIMLLLNQIIKLFLLKPSRKCAKGIN